MNRFLTVLLAGLTALTLGCGYSSKSTTPPVAGAVPTLAALAPSTATAGSAGFTMTVNGSNFSTTAAVNWNGTALTTTYISAAQLMATVSAADIASAATVPVTVTNPTKSGTGAYGSGGTLAETSGPMNFTIN
jgi:hypothetical protein